MAVKREAERSAEGGERAFSAIGFGCFQSNFVHLARRVSATFACAMAFADDAQTIGPNGNSHLAR